MTPVFLLAMISTQAPGQALDPAPRVVHETVTTTDPGLLPCHEFDAQIGKPIQAFDFEDLTGRHWKSSDLLGKVVYLNVWFTGCPPCVQEMPSLNAVFDEVGGKGDIVMLSVALDKPEVLRAFLTTHALKLPAASVSLDQIKRLASVEGNLSFPTHLIIDREGRLALASRGGSSQILKALRHSLDAIASRRSASSTR